MVPRGKADKIFINTTGVGVRRAPQAWQPRRIQKGDVAILSRDIGAHGVSVMCARNQLGISADIQSDCHELLTVTETLIGADIDVRCARDLYRGGLLSAAVEIATTSHKRIELEDQLIPRQTKVQSVCELLGLDVFAIASEGAFLFFVSEPQAERALQILKQFSHTERAAVIGRVVDEAPNSGQCLLKNGFRGR